MRKWFKKNDDEIIEIQVDDTERSKRQIEPILKDPI